MKNKPRTETQNPPLLRFSPLAWSKLLFLRDQGETEVGGFGISTAEDLLLIEDMQLVGQEAGWMDVAFDDCAVADFFEEQVELGRQPCQFGRIWIHTHPGNSAEPSHTDEETFSRVFGAADWAVMFILARGGQTYARLRFNVGPGGEIPLDVQLDFAKPFAGCDFTAWEEEYRARVKIRPHGPRLRTQRQPDPFELLSDEQWELAEALAYE